MSPDDIDIFVAVEPVATVGVRVDPPTVHVVTVDNISPSIGVGKYYTESEETDSIGSLVIPQSVHGLSASRSLSVTVITLTDLATGEIGIIMIGTPTFIDEAGNVTISFGNQGEPWPAGTFGITIIG